MKTDYDVADMRKALEMARAQIETWREVAQAIEKALAQTQGIDVKTAKTLEKREFATLSAPRAAEIVLVEAGTPLHLKEIISRMKKRGYKVADDKMFYTSLFTNLSRQKKKFKKTSPGTFAVVFFGYGYESVVGRPRV